MKRIIEKTFLLLVCLFLISCRTDFKSNNLSFDSEQWKNGDLRLRGQMVENLARSKILEGKTKSAVKDLLGEPFHINSMSVAVETWSYQTDKGLNFGEGIWIHWLHVDFNNQNGLVTKNYITD